MGGGKPSPACNPPKAVFRHPFERGNPATPLLDPRKSALSVSGAPATRRKRCVGAHCRQIGPSLRPTGP